MEKGTADIKREFKNSRNYVNELNFRYNQGFVQTIRLTEGGT